MVERKIYLGREWVDEGDSYFSLVGHTEFCSVAYVALPVTHPDCGKDYEELSPEVNGELTFGADNVFGWDYGHYKNKYDSAEDIQNALAYFRGRMPSMKGA
jgi:hypothetical protein